MVNLQQIPSPDLQPRFRPGLRVIIVGVSYFLATQLAFWLSRPEGVAAIWPAGAIGLVALLVNPRWLWPTLVTVLFASGVAANILAGRPPMTCVGFMFANIVETVLSAGVILYSCGDRILFRRIKEIGGLIFAATVINAVTAGIGSGVATYTLGTSFWQSYQTWWVVNGAGLMLFTPAIGLMRQKISPGLVRPQRVVETMLLLLTAGVGAGMLCGAAKLELPMAPSPYSFHAGLIWTALVFTWIICRFGPSTMAVVLMMIAIIAIGFTVFGPGYPLSGYSRDEALMIIQAYLGIAAIVGLFIAAGVEESRQTGEAFLQDKVRVQIMGHDFTGEV